MAEDVPENHVVSENVGMLTGVTEQKHLGLFRSNLMKGFRRPAQRGFSKFPFLRLVIVAN